MWSACFSRFHSQGEWQICFCRSSRVSGSHSTVQHSTLCTITTLLSARLSLPVRLNGGLFCSQQKFNSLWFTFNSITLWFYVPIQQREVTVSVSPPVRVNDGFVSHSAEAQQSGFHSTVQRSTSCAITTVWSACFSRFHSQGEWRICFAEVQQSLILIRQYNAVFPCTITIVLSARLSQSASQAQWRLLSQSADVQ